MVPGDAVFGSVNGAMSQQAQEWAGLIRIAFHLVRSDGGNLTRTQDSSAA
jgi:hypothetical protein